VIRILLLTLAACGFSPSPTATSAAAIDLVTPWTRHTIFHGNCDATHQCSGADGVHIAGSGEGLLVTAPWEQSSKLTVSTHPGYASVKTASSWSTTVVPATINAPEDSFFADVDGDGNLDLIGACDAGKKITISFGPAPYTTTIVLTASVNYQNWLTIGGFLDVDGDGAPDIVAGGRIGANSSVGYFTNLTGAWRTASAYTWTQVGRVGSVYSIVPLDVDGDGDLDLVISDGAPIGSSNTLMGSRWLESPVAAGGSTWTNHMIHTYNGANQSARYLWAESGRVIDGSSIDSGTNTGQLAIRTTSDWSTWSSTTVPWSTMTNAGRYKAVAPADIDGDGCEDLVVTMHHADSDPTSSPEDLSGVAWFQSDCAGDWSRGEISGIEGYHFDAPILYDVDGDGDLDVIADEQGLPGTIPVSQQLGVVWYENPAVP
jgi:hypothetical protein